MKRKIVSALVVGTIGLMAVAGAYAQTKPAGDAKTVDTDKLIELMRKDVRAGKADAASSPRAARSPRS